MECRFAVLSGVMMRGRCRLLHRSTTTFSTMHEGDGRVAPTYQFLEASYGTNPKSYPKLLILNPKPLKASSWLAQIEIRGSFPNLLFVGVGFETFPF